MKNFTKKTVAAIAAAAMAVSAMGTAISVSAAIASNVSSVADALANVKYTDTTVDVRQAYNAASATAAFSLSGDYAVSSDGKLLFEFNDIDTAHISDGLVKAVTVAVKSGGTTASVTLTADEKLVDSSKDNAGIIYSDEIESLFTASDKTTLEIDVKDFPEALQTLFRTNKNLTAAAEPAANGMVWETGSGWDIRKAKDVDSITVTITLEERTAAEPSKKELARLSGLFDDVTMDISGDIREYTVSNNKLYIAAKYDKNVPAATLPASVQSKVDNMRALGCYLDFDNYCTDLASDAAGEGVISFAKKSDAIYDYLNYGLVIEAYHAALDTSTTGNTFWYDSGVMTSAEADAQIAAANAVHTGLYAAAPLDARSADNKTDFVTVSRAVKSGSSGPLNAYITAKAYSAIIKDSDAGFIESPDYAQMITNYSTLNTALNNIANEITASEQLANTPVNTHSGIENTVKTSTVSETRPLTVTANEWANIGMLYTNSSSSMGMPLISRLNALIGTNKGVKLIISVDPASVQQNKGTANSYGYPYTSVGAARLRVNGAFAITVNDMAAFDSQKNTYTYDRDAITNGMSQGLWSLEMTAYNTVGVNSVTVSVPDQEQYLTAIGANTPAEGNNSVIGSENKNDGFGSLSAGEGREDESEPLDEVISEKIPDKAAETHTPAEEPANKKPATNFDPFSDETNSGADISDSGNPGKPETGNDITVSNPNTGTRGTETAAGISAAILACASAALAAVRRKLIN